MSKATMPQRSEAVKRLVEAGIMPEMCTGWSLTCKTDSAVTMTMSAYVSEGQLSAIADALIDHPEEVAAMVKEYVLVSRETGKQVQVTL